MDKIRQAAKTIDRMTFTQCQEMANPTTSRGLLSNPVAEDPRKLAIFKSIGIYISALLPELSCLAGPVNHVQNAELGNQSLNSLALISAGYTATSIGVLTQLATAHLVKNRRTRLQRKWPNRLPLPATATCHCCLGSGPRLTRIDWT
jgi:phenylalanine ammonia-lyase